MHKLLTLLALALLAPTAFAQIGVKDFVKQQLQNSTSEHNQKIEDAMKNKTDQPKPAPATDAIKDGWITRKAKDNKTDVRLYFAYPANLNKSAPAPALVVLQEWWGLNADIQERTREFAKHGFYAVAPDLYHGHSSDDPKVAATLRKALSEDVAMIDMKTALDLLSEEVANGVVDAKRIGSIGWCMGGHESLLLSLADPRVKATAIFYGGLITDPVKLKALQGPVLGIFGNNDRSPGITKDDVAKFKAALKESGKADSDIEILQYDGVGHAFASKAAAKMGAYNEAKAKEAWAKTWEWLDAKLK